MSREIALNNTILRSRVGSELFGLSTGPSDTDEMGICIEPPSCVIGLEQFEQHQDRRHADGTRIGNGERSGVGDLDLTIYSLRKFVRLAAQGNPSLLLLLWAPSEYLIECTAEGQELQSLSYLFLSKACGYRHLGYLNSQREGVLGNRSKHTNRPELIETYGYDVKYTSCAVRLGIQGIELLTTGAITLPMPEPERTQLRSLRTGGYSRDEAVEWIDDLRSQLEILTSTVDLPERADYPKLNDWLEKVHLQWWAS